MIQYEYYVMHGDKILSGWPCKEDAQEQAKETRENGVACKVSARITLEKRGIATRQKKNWFNEHEIVRNPVEPSPLLWAIFAMKADKALTARQKNHIMHDMNLDFVKYTRMIDLAEKHIENNLLRLR